MFVAVGDSETVGIGSRDPLHDAWPQLVYRSALPRATVFVNLATEEATAADAQDQVDEALALDPTVVTVWLNANDLMLRTPVGGYERDLRALVGRLRGSGGTRVLLATAPPLPNLPGDLRPEYNAAIGRVARRTGATLVDIGRLQLDAPDGLHPDTAGHRAVAGAFAAAYRKVTNRRG